MAKINQTKKLNEAAVLFKETHDTASFTIIYEFVQKCAGILSRKFGNACTADISQDSALIVLELINQYRPEKSSFYNWCYTIVLNEFRQRWHQKQKISDMLVISDEFLKDAWTVRAAGTDESLNNYDIAVYAITAQDIIETIDSKVFVSPVQELFTNEQYNRFLYLYYIDDAAVSDIARELDIKIYKIRNSFDLILESFVTQLHALFPDREFPEYKPQIYTNGAIKSSWHQKPSFVIKKHHPDRTGMTRKGNVWRHVITTNEFGQEKRVKVPALPRKCHETRKERAVRMAERRALGLPIGTNKGMKYKTKPKPERTVSEESRAKLKLENE